MTHQNGARKNTVHHAMVATASAQDRLRHADKPSATRHGTAQTQWWSHEIGEMSTPVMPQAQTPHSS